MVRSLGVVAPHFALALSAGLIATSLHLMLPSEDLLHDNFHRPPPPNDTGKLSATLEEPTSMLTYRHGQESH